MVDRMSHFLYKVKTAKELPAHVLEALDKIHPIDFKGDILVIPPQEYDELLRLGRFTFPIGRRITPARTLVFDDEQVILITQMKDNTISTKVVPHQSLINIDLETNLLYGYIHLFWVNAGNMISEKIEYNTVGDHILLHQVDNLRIKAWSTTYPVNQTLGDNLDIINSHIQRSVPVKFVNYLLHALLPAEQVQIVFYHPEIRLKKRWYKQLISPKRLVALTNRNVILMEEEMRDTKANYSIITRCFPLNYIRHINTSFDPITQISWIDMTFGNIDVQRNVTFPLQEKDAMLFIQSFNSIKSQ